MYPRSTIRESPSEIRRQMTPDRPLCPLPEMLSDSLSPLRPESSLFLCPPPQTKLRRRWCCLSHPKMAWLQMVLSSPVGSARPILIKETSMPEVAGEKLPEFDQDMILDWKMSPAAERSDSAQTDLRAVCRRFCNLPKR